MTKEEEILNFLDKNIFEPILTSKKASKELKAGVNLTIIRLKQRDAKGMVQYFWSAMMGTPNSINFADKIEQEGFRRFEDVYKEFREKFSESWLYSK